MMNVEGEDRPFDECNIEPSARNLREALLIVPVARLALAAR